MNKRVYLVLSILEISRIVLHELWYGYVKKNEAKLSHIDIDFFTVYIKKEDIYNNIAKDLAARLDISNCKLKKPLPREKNTKVWINKLAGKIMTYFSLLRPKRYIYLMDDNDKKSKRQQCVS